MPSHLKMSTLFRSCRDAFLTLPARPQKNFHMKSRNNTTNDASAIIPDTMTKTLHLVPSDGADSLRVRNFKLLIINGQNQGQELVVNKERFTIGTGPANDLILEDATVSRTHSEIEATTEGYAIRDMGSTNGTIIQGVRVTEAYLMPGTEFQLGNTRIVFCPLQESTEYALSSKDSLGDIIGGSIPMRRLYHIAETYARTDATVLIEGETGTGKELLAEMIHRHSPRRDKPFVVIDCASLASNLIASELFGHSKGAFTGANTDRVGAFEHANGGTVFLDEIGDLELDMQPHLLRVLEKKEIRKVGTNAVQKVDVRIISATNRRLESEVNANRFREDLFFRLSVVHLEVPPLRRRKDDLAMLTEFFLCKQMGDDAMTKVLDFEKAISSFQQYDWPGNVRELRNLVELASYSEKHPIDLSTFLYLGRMKTKQDENPVSINDDRPFKDAKNGLIKDFEKGYIKRLLDRHEGNISSAAREAEIERAYLQRLVAKHGLRRGKNDGDSKLEPAD
jgi:DNA-binding NtrC family response regulator